MLSLFRLVLEGRDVREPLVRFEQPQLSFSTRGEPLALNLSVKEHADTCDDDMA